MVKYWVEGVGNADIGMWGIGPHVRTIGVDMRDHRKLRAFELADDLAVGVYRATASFPRAEMNGLTSQMRRAALSVASNIVEGSARLSRKDFVWFLDIAYGSLCEVEYQISLAEKLELLKVTDASELGDMASETGKVLNGLIRSLIPSLSPLASRPSPLTFRPPPLPLP